MSYVYQNLFELAAKVDHEGGLLEAAFGYGIRSGDIADDEMRALWIELETGYQAIAPVIRRIEDLLGTAYEAGDPDDTEYDDQEGGDNE